MKTTIFLSVAILLLSLGGNISSQEVANQNAPSKKGAVAITSTPDLYELATTWASEYTVLNPGTEIKVTKASAHTIDLGSTETLGLISNISLASVKTEPSWFVAVGRDIIVPIINKGNPFMEEILKRGISQQQLAQMLISPDKQSWGTLMATEQSTPVHCYIVNDETVLSGVVKFIQTSQLPAIGFTIGTKDEVVSAIQKDPLAIGFCKVVHIMGTDNQSLVENVSMLPIDRNGNGTLDNMENIYSDVNVFLRGVWIGKYPKSLYSTIYAVSKVKPANEAEVAFLSWVLTDGQRYINPNGFCELAGSESQAQMDKLNVAIVSAPAVKDASSQAGLILLILALVITLGLVISAVVRRYRKQEGVVPDFNVRSPGFDENSVSVPKGLYFDKSHTWAFMEKDGAITIGIDDFLQHVTGPVTRVEMKNAGEKIKKGDLLFSIIQYGKQLNLYSPISGTIKKHNEALVTDSSIINASPYSDGWVYKIEPTQWLKEIQFLDMAEKYKRWIDTEFSRVKDFLAATLKPDSLEYSHVVLQDGGVIKEGILAEFGPEVWEDFQTDFLDTYK